MPRFENVEHVTVHIERCDNQILVLLNDDDPHFEGFHGGEPINRSIVLDPHLKSGQINYLWVIGFNQTGHSNLHGVIDIDGKTQRFDFEEEKAGKLFAYKYELSVE